jgi:hypothetical protein
MGLFTKKERSTGFPRFSKSERNYDVKVKNYPAIKAHSSSGRKHKRMKA